MAQFKQYIGTKDFYLKTIAIAIPIMAQQFVTSFVNLIDNVMIGSVGATALTSVTIANKYYWIFNSTLFGVCGAAGIFISQHYGAKNKSHCQKVFNISELISILVAFIYMSILFIAPEAIIRLFSSTPEIVQSAMEYVEFARFTYLPTAISMACMMGLRAVADNKIQLKIGSLAVAINTMMNYLLIFGHFGFPALGVKGAAIATLMARVVEMIAYLYILYHKKHYFELDLKGWVYIDISLMKSMLAKAVPLVCNEIFFALGTTMVFKSYMRVDEYLVAAISVVDTVTNIAFIIFGGLSSAISILIGERLGANAIEEAKDNAKKLIVFGAAVAFIIGWIVIAVSGLIPMIYQFDDTINHTITTLLRIKGILLPVYVINVCVFFTLRAGGDALSTMIMDSGYLWAISVMVSTGLSMFTSISLVMLYLLVECLDFVKMFVAFYFFNKGKWARNMTQGG